MSQLIKKLKATQAQNVFVTPEAAAKIISSSVRKSKKNYCSIWFVLFLIATGIIGSYFFYFKKKNVQYFSNGNPFVDSNEEIIVQPLTALPDASLELADSCEELVTTVDDMLHSHKNLYQQGASLYIKDFPEFIPSLGLLLSKHLDPYLENCTQFVQQVKKIKKPHVVYKKASQKPKQKQINLKDINSVLSSIRIPQPELAQDVYDEQDDFVVIKSKLTEEQQNHLEVVHNLLNHMQIESVREEGAQSRLKANGHIYHPNALVSMKPRLIWIGIQQNELIFYDEYKQEYRKKIAQN